jgi:NAD(P)-dependent dehydrogenase (short-subunit alcohol dehydrogenase family)
MSKPSAIVIGVGALAGLGAALCQRFAASGHHVFIVARTEARIADVAQSIRQAGGSAEPIFADATSRHDVAAVFERAFSENNHDIEAPDLVVFNTGANRPADFLSLEPEEFEAFWRASCFAGFLVGQEAARRMLPNHKGTILFTGASGSLRGKPGYAQFAAAKAGLRMVSQSMAREFGPRGLHVAHILIDGGIDGEVLRSRWPDIAKQRGEDGLLKTAAIADNYWNLYQQDPSTWSQEIDLRPFKEYF